MVCHGFFNAAIIIGHTPEGKAQGSAAVAVSAIADYLESQGY